jgi:hypothetical protein
MNWKNIFLDSEKRVRQAETPEPVAATNLEQQLVSELHTIDDARGEIGQAMADFRRNQTAIVDGKLVYQTDKVTNRPALDRIWSGFLSADSKLLQSRNAILNQLAKIRCPDYVA